MSSNRSRLVIVFTLFLFLLNVAASPAQAQAESGMTVFIPVLQATESADLGLALSNPALSEAIVTLTARTYGGSLISGEGITNPASLKVPPSGQVAKRAVEIFGSGLAGKSGWVELTSSSSTVRGFFLLFDSTLSFMDGAELQGAGSNRLIFPKVNAEARLAFVHTGSESVPSTAISIYENSGRLVSRNLIKLAPRSGFSGPITDLFPEATNFEGYVVVETGNVFNSGPNTLTGLETYRDRSDVAALAAVPDGARLRTGYLPHLAAQGGYSTRLAMINFTSVAQTVRITAAELESNGARLNPPSITVERTVPPFGRIEQSVSDLFSLTGETVITGYISFDTQGDGPGFVVYLDYRTSDGVMLAAVPAQGSGYSDLYFSQVAESDYYYTGLAFLNPNSQTASLTLEIYDGSGTRTAATALTLPPHARRSRLLSELVPQLFRQVGGYVRVTASRPITAFQLFGLRASQTALANVVAQGVQLNPLASGRTVSVATGANVISSASSSSVVIPPGALKHDTRISLNSVELSTLPDTATGQKPVGSIDAQPSGTDFTIPPRLTFPLGVQLRPGTELNVSIYGNGQYKDTGFKAIVDESGRTATASVTHFTTFVVTLPPDRLINVSGMVPSSGIARTAVRINGSGFSTNPAGNEVMFAGADNTAIAATVTDAAATSLTVMVPVGAISGSVIVRVGDQTSIGILFTVPVDNPKPVISSISPTGVPFGSTSASVEISGTGFLPSSHIRFDGRDLTPAFQDETFLLISLAENELNPGIHKAVVLNPAPGGGESNSVDFTVKYPTPSISSISATEGPAGTDIVITGTGFTAMSIVLVDGGPAGGTYVNPTTMLITLAPVVADRVISVSNPLPGGGNSNSVRFRVTDSPPPSPPAPPPPPVPPGPPASLLTVAVQISSGVTPIGSYQVTLTFNPSLVQLSSLNVTGGNGGGFAAGPTTVNIDNRAGTVTLNQFITSNNPSGTFTVTNLTFTPIHAGTVNLGLIVNAVTDRLANDVVPLPPVTLVPSSILVIN